MNIKLLIEGGSMSPGPALSQKLGPIGINIGQVISKVNEATANFKGLKVPVVLDVDPATKSFEVEVFSPPVSELIKKELGITKGSGLQEKEKVANASIEQIISIAKTKLPNLLCKDLKSAVKTVIGTCVSLGVLVENKVASEMGTDIDHGKYDSEIQEEKTEASPEKKAKLEKYFSKVKLAQEKKLKEEEAAAAEAEAAKAEAATEASETEEGTTPTETPEGEPAPDEAKPAPVEEKK